MQKYIHELPDWPEFKFNASQLLGPLAKARSAQGNLVGRLEGMGVTDQQTARVDSMISEVLTSSEIEGESLDYEQVRSSIARRLGIEHGGVQNIDHRTEGVVEMALDAAGNWRQPLSKERLLTWQAGMFPGGRGPYGRVTTGSWRTDDKGPMQVVSGAIGQERVHFEAPHAETLEAEMRSFIKWFESDDGTDMVLRAGIAHLWFETVHPFDDGNGRVGRAILDLALARADAGKLRCYSVSTQLRKERQAYYEQLEASQKGSMDATNWLLWYLGCFERAIETASQTVSGALRRSRFWASHIHKPLNHRQSEMISRMLMGWEGKMTTSKWAKIKKVPERTAQRDLTELFEMGILARVSRGRGTAYILVPLEDDH